MSEDYMEVGDLIPLENGWWLEKETGNKISPSGITYNANGEVVDTDPDDG